MVCGVLKHFIGGQYYKKDPIPDVGWRHDDQTGIFYLATLGLEAPAPSGTSLVIENAMVRLMKAADAEKIVKEIMENYSQPDRKSSAFSTLDIMLDMQREVESAWGRLPDPADDEKISQYIREVILCATDELHEVLAEVHWKPWKTHRGIKDISAYREELADVMHFVLDLYLAAGLTGEDIYTDYVEKHYKNMDRTTSKSYKER